MLLLNSIVAMRATVIVNVETTAMSGIIVDNSQPFVIMVLIGSIVWVKGFQRAMSASQEGIASSGKRALLVNMSGMVRKFITTINVS